MNKSILSFKGWMRVILEKNLGGLPNWQRSGLRAVQVSCAVARDMIQDRQFTLHATALVYTTLITLIPLLAISFSMLKGFGVHDQIEPLLLSALEGLGPEKSQEVTAQVIRFVDNVQIGVLGAIGVVFLLYTSIGLMQKVEGAFNYIWRVGQHRTLAQRFSHYLSVLIMGPLLIFTSAGITTTINHTPLIRSVTEALSGWPLVAMLFEFSSILVPWLLMAAGLAFFYIYMPNTKVRISGAVAGAMVAALIWKLMGMIFSSFIVGSANYAVIYAAFATLILLMIWLYASWLVVLIGANISFYLQYPRYLHISRAPLVLSPRIQLLLGLSVLARITENYYKSEDPWDLDGLSKDMNVPVLAVQKVVALLERAGILLRSNEDPPRYYPALPLETTPLQRAVEALEYHGHESWLETRSMHIPPQAERIAGEMSEARAQAVTNRSIVDAFKESGP